ncbi:MAG: Flagellar Assembly Protein [Firmicutes bacterium]|nr:Flagellar Assembly Protein [Bacillota bacterium]
MESINAGFSVQVRDDGVYLSVSPFVEGNRPVALEQVLDALTEQHIVVFNRLAVEEAVRLQNSEAVRIAEPQKERPAAEISMVVSRDRMEAFLQVDVPEGAGKPDMEMIMARIEKAGIVSGVIMDSIVAALRQPGLRVLCATGTQPEPGTDATLISRVDLENRGKPAETEDGGVDFKNLGLYISVEKGQILAEKIPPTPGVPGVDVCGNTVPARAGKDLVLHHGANIQVVDDVKLVAAAGGNLVMIGGKMSISPILQIKGDVDLSTGNINFAGDVVIQGSVQEGFSVIAGGNVDVSGMVSGGCVEGANITVRMGVIGLTKTVLKASGSVTAKFVENAKVVADHDILVTDVVLQSQLSAGKKIRVEGRRGQIVGGIAAAGDEIILKSAGSSSATPTDLQAGVNPKLREEYFALRKDLKNAEVSLDQLQKGLFTLRSMDQGQMPPEKKELLLKITRAQFTTMGQVETMRKRLGELETAYEELRSGQIKISDYVFPGVKITIGSLIKPIQQEVRFVTYYAEAGEIKFRPFK